jgi:hypothetical protein
LFPAFQPPSVQLRSSSIETPVSTRSFAPSSDLQDSQCFGAITLKLVGTTQLAVSRVHGHPNFAGSIGAARSIHRNFHRHGQSASLPRFRTSHAIAFDLACAGWSSAVSALIARAVIQDGVIAVEGRPASVLPLPSQQWFRRKVARVFDFGLQREVRETGWLKSSLAAGAVPPHAILETARLKQFGYFRHEHIGIMFRPRKAANACDNWIAREMRFDSFRKPS